MWGSTKRAWHALQRDRIPQMAAALTFRTLFSLVPVTIIAVLVLRLFRGSEEVTGDIVSWLVQFAGFDRFSAPPGAIPPSGPVPLDPSAGGGSGGELARFIEELVTKASSVNFGAIGGIGILVLVYAAIGLMSEIESSFNHLYRAERGRSWARRVQRYWFFLTLGPVLLWATFAASNRFGQLAAGPAIGFGITLVLAWVLLLLAYTTIPNARVHIRGALAGSFVAAFCWQISKVVFTYYVSRATTTFSLYGSLGLLPIFLLWVYFTWILALFGLKITYTFHHFSRFIDDPFADRSVRLTDPTAGVAIMLEVARAFGHAEAADVREIADRTEIDAGIVEFMLDRFADEGLVRRAEGEDGEDDAFVPARPPDEIPVSEILRSVRGVTSSSRRGPGGDAQEQIWDALEGVVGARTLGNLLRAGGESPGPDERSGARLDAT